MKNQAKIKAGLVVTVLLVVGLLVVVSLLFVKNSSPYRTIAQAKASKGNGSIHIQADVDKKSVLRNLINQELRFIIEDPKTHEAIPVIYHGAIPESFDQATRVVVVGSIKNGIFEATQIQTKCPSRYSADEKSK
ncbi:MAG: cytochrome c maturation protein CcmE [bacterium]|jgi:cytochrome c-type biogenesis protein CcmE